MSGSTQATNLVFAPLLHCLYTDACDASDDQREQADPNAGSEDGQQQLAHTITRAIKRSRRAEYVGATTLPGWTGRGQCPVRED
jgi:hypothetical protein